MSSNTVPSTPTTRRTYPNLGTPPITPVHNPSSTSIDYLSISPHNHHHHHPSYPESPHSPRHSPLPSPLDLRPPPPPRFSLGHPGRRKSKWSPPKMFRTTRRTLLLLSFLLIVIFLFRYNPKIEGGLRVGHLKWARWFYPQEKEGICQFVSPVEAYHRDLQRLKLLNIKYSYHPFYTNDSQYPPLSHPSPNHLRSDRDKDGKEDYVEYEKQNHKSHSHSHSHHLYSSTGHLLISTKSSHPIPLLLTLGEKRWEELLSRQSRTLGESVREYTRRYGRLPPKGYDLWWEFSMLNELVLPDEYDRINLDLAPFFALPKKEFKRRMELVEEMKETFTLVIEDGRVGIEIKDPGGLEWGGTLPRANDAASLISSFSRYLPDLRATFSIFDQPQIYLSWARRGSLVDLGLRGELTTHLHETDDAKVRLSRSCDPDSNFRRNMTFQEGRSLIYDSLEAGDFCQNPYLIPLHGLTIETHDRDSHPRPHTQLLPLFSLAKTSINSDILITPLDQFHSDKGPDPKWEDKKSAKLAWRGSPTGISMMTTDVPWRNSHRIRLHHFANNQSLSPITYLVPDLGLDEHHQHHHHHREQGTGLELGSKFETSLTNTSTDFFFDMKLAGEPIQCSEEDGTCEDMKREIDWAGYQSPEELNDHKFLLDIDGNGWSGRFRRLMSTNSVVIKTGIFTEWFQPHLIPWFMYIPSKLDFSDLMDIMSFFRGSPQHPELAFDETAKALARNGQCFVQRMFRSQDLEAYMMRLFLEYARLAADEDVDMDFHYDPSDEHELEMAEIREEMEMEMEQNRDLIEGAGEEQGEKEAGSFLPDSEGLELSNLGLVDEDVNRVDWEELRV
ncbi:hypothetical protein TREMEDRAFT_42362 [Tremella mesenterica DSM 1558]|uniref:uncharacterized protein n=1 Tax=Tremella mesenterica (strain ATCC 24925 / CBS 8224 / DSM 1558 / NBRC 9311 / NRRL Y-6157 / RJB 2259-6 / UBC 559-6) TaxID=578456 RepID=UPI0003F494F3|nr:uncharacterized protein TREMEDRAFT_42362 [Tremella mesenterica DSM 1558]EIW73449.1 hypothetical protein TREMEDRAFT_42362 [Tremella mesenterica DSM 1558]